MTGDGAVRRDPRRCRPRAGWCWAPRPPTASRPRSTRCSSTSPAHRVDITDRNVVVASVPRGEGGRHAGAPGCSSIEIISSDGRHVRDVRRADGHRRQGPAQRVRRPQPAAVDRRRLHRPERRLHRRDFHCRRRSTPGSPPARRALKLAAMRAGHRLHRHRAASHCGGSTSSTAGGCNASSRRGGARSPPSTPW